MTITVSITKGYYRGELVSGIFPLVKPYQEGARGGFITIKNANPKAGNPPVQRITVELGDFTIMGSDGQAIAPESEVIMATPGRIEVGVDYEKLFIESESEDDAMERIADTFLMLDKIVDSCAKGIIRGLVVSGPPGIGKSFGVEKQLDTANMFRKMTGQDPKYEVVSGGASSIGLYQKLYYNRAPEQVLVFDDCDGVLFDEESLNLLKAALNSGDKRRICWNKESRTLAAEDIPSAFDFEGSIIFLSNIDFERTIAKGSRISQHLEAIMSRCHYLDLEIGSLRDKLLRIKQIVRDGMLTPYCFSPEEEASVLDFVFSNAEYLREVSLRMVKKIADFVKTDPQDWVSLSESTCLQREAKFKRLLAKKKEAEKHGVELAGV